MMKRILVLVLLILFLPHSAMASMQVQKVTSPGGIKAWLIEDKTAPVISITFQWQTGSMYDPDGKEGRATLLSGLLDEGAGDLSGPDFQRALVEISTSLSFDAGLYDFTGNMRMLSQQAEKSFDLLGLALSKPHFNSEKVKLIKNQLAARLLFAQQRPDAVADRAWWKMTFPNQPHAKPVDGTMAGLQNITREDLFELMKRGLTRDRLTIGVAGDIDGARLGALLDKAFGDLPAVASLPAVNLPRMARTDRPYLVQRDIPQAVVVFGQDGLKRNDRDFYGLHLMNYILGGGGFSSRLMDEMREKRGLTYGVSTQLATYPDMGLIRGSFATQNNSLVPALQILQDEWGKIQANGVLDDEVRQAKLYMIGSFPLRFGNTLNMASMLVGMQIYDLGVDYFDQRRAYIDQVRVEQINKVAEKTLFPGRMVIVVVGNPPDPENYQLIEDPVF